MKIFKAWRGKHGIKVPAIHLIGDVVFALFGMAIGPGAAQDFTTQAWKKLMNNPDKIMEGHKNTNLWLSAWDIRLRAPFGMCMYFQDISTNAIGGVYAEGTKVNTHNINQSAGQLIMVEGITFGFDRLVPVRGIGRSQF